MRRKLALLALAGATAVAAEPPAGFDARVDQVRRASGVPGMAIAIVEHGKVVLAKGYGVRKLGAPDPVDEHTIFMIGSTGKALTAAAMATLVDAGKVGWDDRVIDHLPGFQMYDPWVTREITIRDLFVHRSGLGLGEGDLLMVPRGRLARAEVVRRLRYLKPATSFRSAYAYDNILYIVAGQVIEAVSGKTWENYLSEHVLRPAGMSDAASDPATQLSRPDRAFPHGRTDGAVRGDGEPRVLDERDRLGQAGAPAGLVAMSASDMARWLQIQLGQGALPDGGRLFSAAQAKEMWTPVTPQPTEGLPKEIAGTEPKFNAYALGWEVRDYRGARMIWHAGGLFGFTSIVCLIPERGVGFAIQLNGEDVAPRYGLMYELLDHYLGAPEQDWPARFAAYSRERIAGAEAAIRRKAATPARIGPSLPLDRYAGRYADPWYGELVVGRDTKGLTVDFTTTPGMTGRLEHHQYDTFVARFGDRAIEPAYLTFALDADGRVARITAKPVSPIADFSFDYGDLDFEPIRPKP